MLGVPPSPDSSSSSSPTSPYRSRSPDAAAPSKTPFVAVNPWSKTSSLHRWGRPSRTTGNSLQNAENHTNGSVYGSPVIQPPEDPLDSPAPEAPFVTVNPWSSSSSARRRRSSHGSRPTTPSANSSAVDTTTQTAASIHTRTHRPHVRFDGVPSEPSSSHSVASYTGIASSHLPKPVTANALGQSNLSLTPQDVAFFVLETAPINLYLCFLLGIPLLYRSRVARICGEAELSLPDIKEMARTRADEWKPKENVGPGGRARTMSFGSWTPVSPPDQMTAVPTRLLKFRSSWENFIETLMKEWQTLNIISVLLLSSVFLPLFHLSLPELASGTGLSSQCSSLTQRPIPSYARRHSSR